MPTPNVDSETQELISELANFAQESRIKYGYSREQTTVNGGTCVTQRVPVALLARIRELAEHLNIEVK